jgi:hypothetical protein
MITIRDDVCQSIGITKDDPAYAKVLQAYRLGFTSGVREIRFAEGLPWKFIAWLDRYFSRCENWKHRYWLDSDKAEPPVLGEYENPYYRRLNVNRSCRFCGHCGNLCGTRRIRRPKNRVYLRKTTDVKYAD